MEHPIFNSVLTTILFYDVLCYKQLQRYNKLNYRVYRASYLYCIATSYVFIKFYLVKYPKLCWGIAIQETRIPSEMCSGGTCITDGTHASLVIYVREHTHP